MNLFFWRRHRTRDFAEAIRPELRALHTPEPSAELLARILTSRRAGARVILPEPPGDRARFRFRYVAATAIAAALLLVIVPRDRIDDVASDRSFAASPFVGQIAFARSAASRAQPELPAVALGRVAAIHPITLRFARRMLDSTGAVASESRNDISLTADTANGIPAWRVTSIEHGATAPPTTQAETLYVSRSDLRLLRRAVHVSPYSRFGRINIEQRFVGDSITGRMTTDSPSIGEGRAIARRLDPAFGPYFSNGLAWIFFMATPLEQGWSGSAALLGWAVLPNDVFTTLAMRVEGEDRIQVPAGTFECWRLSVRVAQKQFTFWARKSDGLGVRLYDDSDKRKSTREVVLVGES